MAWSRRLQEAKDRLAALSRQRYPDGIERIRVLLAWAGIPSRESTGGLQWYDMALQEQLLSEDPALVLAAAATRPSSPDRLDGAAELFGSTKWTEAHGRGLPKPLRSMLGEHIQADGTDAMRFRMSHGYYGARRTV